MAIAFASSLASWMLRCKSLNALSWPYFTFFSTRPLSKDMKRILGCFLRCSLLLFSSRLGSLGSLGLHCFFSKLVEFLLVPSIPALIGFFLRNSSFINAYL